MYNDHSKLVKHVALWPPFEFQSVAHGGQLLTTAVGGGATAGRAGCRQPGAPVANGWRSGGAAVRASRIRGHLAARCDYADSGL
eukprot:6630787-Pyramimonas_sp.AAC.2